MLTCKPAISEILRSTMCTCRRCSWWGRSVRRRVSSGRPDVWPASSAPYLLWPSTRRLLHRPPAPGTSDADDRVRVPTCDWPFRTWSSSSVIYSCIIYIDDYTLQRSTVDKFVGNASLEQCWKTVLDRGEGQWTWLLLRTLNSVSVRAYRTRPLSAVKRTVQWISVLYI